MKQHAQVPRSLSLSLSLFLHILFLILTLSLTLGYISGTDRSPTQVSTARFFDIPVTRATILRSQAEDSDEASPSQRVRNLGLRTNNRPAANRQKFGIKMPSKNVYIDTLHQERNPRVPALCYPKEQRCKTPSLAPTLPGPQSRRPEEAEKRRECIQPKQPISQKVLEIEQITVLPIPFFSRLPPPCLLSLPLPSYREGG